MPDATYTESARLLLCGITLDALSVVVLTASLSLENMAVECIVPPIVCGSVALMDTLLGKLMCD